MNYKLNDDEQEILDALEQDELQSAPNASEQIEIAKAASNNAILKTHRVNLRLTERDFYLAHVKASEEGLPYQTLLASVIHKYLSGRLVERSS
jgi:predicted DNA binding CopG/RHH family protein